MSNIDKNKMETWFTENHDSMVELLKNVLNQKKVVFDTTITDEHNVSDLVLSEEYPRVGIQFIASREDSLESHLLTIDIESMNNLYSMISGESFEGELTEEQMSTVQNSLDALLKKISNLFKEESDSVNFQDISITRYDSGDNIEKLLPKTEGLSLIHTFSFGKEKIISNHYSWSKQEGDDLIDVSSAEFDTFKTDRDDSSSPRNMDMLMDVELEVLVELGRKSMKIQDVLKLGKGSLIELDKSAGEPLSIFVNNRKLAEGEVVVVDDSFGIRITKLASTKERIKSLG